MTPVFPTVGPNCARDGDKAPHDSFLSLAGLSFRHFVSLFPSYRSRCGKRDLDSMTDQRLERGLEDLVYGHLVHPEPRDQLAEQCFRPRLPHTEQAIPTEFAFHKRMPDAARTSFI